MDAHNSADACESQLSNKSTWNTQQYTCSWLVSVCPLERLHAGLKPVSGLNSPTDVIVVRLPIKWCWLQATQVSPWVVTLDALEPFKCAANTQDPPVLPYLRESNRHTWDITLSAAIKPAGSDTETVVTRSNLQHL